MAAAIVRTLSELLREVFPSTSLSISWERGFDIHADFFHCLPLGPCQHVFFRAAERIGIGHEIRGVRHDDPCAGGGGQGGRADREHREEGDPKSKVAAHGITITERE